MLQKFQKQREKEQQEKEKNKSQPELIKEMMKNKKKQKLESTNLPKFAKVIEEYILCTICGQTLDDLVTFQGHLALDYHIQAVRNLKEQIKQKEEQAKRENQVPVDVLEAEANVHTMDQQKSKRLTKEQIDRINKEVEEEFAQKIEQEGQLQEFPQDFFDIEQPILSENNQDGQEEQKEEEFEIEELRKMVNEKKKKKKKGKSKYDFLDQGLEGEVNEHLLELDWKSKK